MSASAVDVEIRCLRAQALTIWHALTDAQRAALRRARADASGVVRLAPETHARVKLGLDTAQLVEPADICGRRRALTPEALLVRREGIAWESGYSRRKYARRARA